jgi:type IV pilus assembly protein PilX
MSDAIKATHCPSVRSRQSGVTLIVCLVFLLLLTLIGVSSMQNANLQEKMAGSVKLRNESFQMAESALRQGENIVAQATFTMPVCSSLARCAPPAEANSSLVAGVGSSGVVWVAGDGGGLYGIQFLGTTIDPMDLASGVPITDTATSYSLYRITAVGTRGTSTTVLESVYAKK